MTGKMFKQTRCSQLKYSQEELAIAMGLSTRTIQEIEAMKEVRLNHANHLNLLVEKDQWVMASIKEYTTQRIALEFPNGIRG